MLLFCSVFSFRSQYLSLFFLATQSGAKDSVPPGNEWFLL